MIHNQSTAEPSDDTFAGSQELWARLDALARAILGVGAVEFVEGYRSGRFSRVPIARDIAALIPFAAPGV